MDEITCPPQPYDRPVTLRDLAEVFGCVWNAAIGAAHQQGAGMDFARILAEGFGAMATRLEELANATPVSVPVVNKQEETHND